MLPLPLGCFALAIFYSFFATYGPPDEIVLGGKPFLQLINGENGMSRLRRTPLISDQAYNPMDDVIIEEFKVVQPITTSLSVVVAQISQMSPSPSLEGLYHGGLSLDGYFSISRHLCKLVGCRDSRLDLLVLELYSQAQEVSVVLLGLPKTGLALLFAIMALFCVLSLSVARIDNTVPQGPSTRRGLSTEDMRTPNKRGQPVSSKSVPPIRARGNTQSYVTSTPSGGTNFIDHPIYRFNQPATNSESTTSFSFCLGQGVSFPTVDISNDLPIAEPSTITFSPFLTAVLSPSAITPTVSQTFTSDTQSDQGTVIDAIELAERSELNGITQDLLENEKVDDEVGFESSPTGDHDAPVPPPIPTLSGVLPVATESVKDLCLLSVKDDELNDDVGFDLFGSFPAGDRDLSATPHIPTLNNPVVTQSNKELRSLCVEVDEPSDEVGFDFFGSFPAGVRDSSVTPSTPKPNKTLLAATESNKDSTGEVDDDVGFDLFGSFPAGDRDSSVTPSTPALNLVHPAPTEAAEGLWLYAPKGDGDLASNSSSPNIDLQDQDQSSQREVADTLLGITSDCDEDGFSSVLGKPLLISTAAITHDLDCNGSSSKSSAQAHNEEPSPGEVGDILNALPTTASIHNDIRVSLENLWSEKTLLVTSTMPVTHNQIDDSPSLKRPRVAIPATQDEANTPVSKKPRLTTDAREETVARPVVPRSPSGLSSNLADAPLPGLSINRPVRSRNRTPEAEELEEGPWWDLWDHLRDVGVQPGSHQLVNLLVERGLLIGCNEHKRLRRLMARCAREARMEEERNRFRTAG